MDTTEPKIERIFNKHLMTLDVNGSACEVCGRHMHAHAWADLNGFGIVVDCSFMIGAK